jgi:hypothetical protein
MKTAILLIFSVLSLIFGSDAYISGKISVGINRFKQISRHFASSSTSSVQLSASDYEGKILELLESNAIKGRGAKTSQSTTESINDLITTLEEIGLKKNKKVAPISANDLDGCWKLLFTSSPGTNSPIQRTFTAIDDGVAVFQVVNVVRPNKNGICESYLNTNQAEVSNTICFGDSTRLRITALASTVS